MNLNSIFRICLFIITKSEPQNANDYPVYFDDLGTFVEKHDELFFYGETAEIYFSRHYPDACGKLKTDKILNTRVCVDRYDSKNSREVLEGLVKECSTQWGEQIQLLQSTTIQKVRRRRMTVGRLTVRKSVPRVKRVALATVGLFAGIISAVTGVFSTLFKIFNDVKINSFKTDQIYTRSRQGTLIAASIADRETENSYTINNIVCDSDALKNLQLRKLHANILLNQNVQYIENEVLNLSFGSLPRNTNFLSNILKICTSFQPNTIHFCKAMVYSNNLGIDFEGVTISNNTLVSLIKLQMPIQSQQFQHNSGLHIINMGNFLNGQFFKISIPNESIVTLNGDVYSLDKSLCNKNFCDINSLELNDKARCLSSILVGKSDHCVNIFGSPPNCNFKRTNTGHIITSVNGLYFPTNTGSISAIGLQNKTFFAKHAGRLLCRDGKKNSTHLLSGPSISHRFNSTIKFVDFHYAKNLKNLSTIQRRFTKDKKLNNQLKEIYKNDDHLNIGQQNIPTPTVIIILSFLVYIVSSLVANFAYPKILPHINWFFGHK